MDSLQYLLVVTAEEAVEVSHATHKVLRFTPYDSHTPGGPSNLETLEKEVNDFYAMLEMLADRGVVINRRQELIDCKKTRVSEYMRYSQLLGVVKE